MLKKINFVAILLVALVITDSSFAFENASCCATRIFTFKPHWHKGMKEKKGFCWTESISASRQDALRCQSESEIYDPCFVYKKNAVICNANPEQGEPGFILHLTKPLPSNKKFSFKEKEVKSGWLLALADGSVCKPFTGTKPFLTGKILKYSCTNNDENCKPEYCLFVGAAEPKKYGNVFMMEKIYYQKGTLEVKREKKVAVARLWQ